MSVSIYFYIEVQDKDGKWHLVKWYSDRNFDSDPLEDCDQERIVEIDGVKHIEKRETCPGLICRDRISWGTRWYGTLHQCGLPDDISEELDKYLHIEFEREKANHLKYYGESSDYKPEYGKKYGYLLMSELFEMCEHDKEEWIKNLKSRIRDKQLEEIRDHLKRIERKVDAGGIGTEFPREKKKKKTEEEEYYEDTLEYYFGEAFWDVINFYEELSEVMEKARMFTGNSWFSPEKTRVTYYYC